MTKAKKKPSDEIAALRAEVEALKSALARKEDKPEPKAPFAPAYQRYDPTERMTMPMSALQAMVAAEPRGFMQGVVRDNRGPSTPTSMIPSSHQPTGGGGPANVPGSGTGWIDPRPLGPSPHHRYVDQQIDAQDRRDRGDLIRQHAQLQATEKVTEQIETMKKQTEALAKLAEPGK